eukprot:m.119784 g.119784  ORF g.119784 m.119784 type:complete len:596 (+) comp21814_c0_seq2:158-1945(+)
MGKKKVKKRQANTTSDSPATSALGRAGAVVVGLLVVVAGVYLSSRGGNLSSSGSSSEAIPTTTETIETIQNIPLPGQGDNVDVSGAARRHFDDAKVHLQAQEWPEAYATLELARTADDWESFPLQNVVDVFQATLLGFDMNPTDESRTQAYELLLNVLKKVPDEPHALVTMGRLLVEFKQYSEAQKYLKRAFKATAGSTLHNKATAEYEIALQFVAFENRQAVNSADKARAQRAWETMVSNALDNPTTAIAAQISQWKARADEVLESQSSTCKLAELVEWNTSKFARSMECPRVHRAHGESIAATLHRAWNGGRASPVVMTGEWPEFPTSDAVFNTLERCKESSKSDPKRKEKGYSPAVVEVLLPRNDGGYAVQLGNASDWIVDPKVADLLRPGEETVMVRGLQEHMLLDTLLSMAGVIPHPLYLAHGNLDVHIPCARSLVTAPTTLVLEDSKPGQTPEEHGKLAEVNLWIGLGGTVSGLHSDAFHNLHRMLQGTKDVLLFPPEEKARLVNPEGIVEIKGSLESKSRVLRNPHFAEADCAEPDGRAAEATAMRCVAQEGETLFIPEGWFHNVLTTPSEESKLACSSVGINLWYTV